MTVVEQGCNVVLGMPLGTLSVQGTRMKLPRGLYVAHGELD